MNLVGNIVINLYSIALLITIYIQSSKQVEKGSLQYNVYMMLLKMTILLLSFDILSRFDNRPETIYAILTRFGNLMMFLLNLVIPSLWIVYVYDQVHQEESKMRQIIYMLIGVNCANAFLVVMSQFNGWLYYFDSNNIYYRGPLFLLPVIVALLLLLFSLLIIVKNRKRIDKKYSIALAFFAVPPYVGIIMQVVFYGISLMLNCIVFSLLIVYLNIQNNNMYTDYLTGVNNRKRLDIYLSERIKMSTKKKSFSAIMIDLDNFKSINDTWGHDAGDEALKTATILLKSCLKKEDFIARFGGDEFCIIINKCDHKELEEAIQKIHNCFKKYNELSNKPYELGFSVGYATYNYLSFMKLEEFQKQLDILLYDNKQRKKGLNRITNMNSVIAE